MPRPLLRSCTIVAAILAAPALIVGTAHDAWAIGRFIESMLYQVRPTDPITLASAPTILLVVALLACFVPARRAMKVDPIVALRYE